MATKIGDLFVRLGLDMTEFSKGLESAQKRLDQQARDWGSMGLGLSAAFTAPLALIAKFSIEAAAGFEQSMNKIKALTKDFSNTSSDYLRSFEKDMVNLSALALDLGKKTQYSSKQVADAMVEMAAAGFSATNIMKGMEGVLSLAAVGALNLADAAQIASSILQGFGLEASAMSRVADMLAKAASISAIGVQDLGYSFKYVGPVAKAAGLNLAEVSAALVVLGNAGIKGEQGGTAIRNMISDLLKPSEQAAKVIAELGLKVTDATGKMLPLADVIDNLKNSNMSLTQGFQIFGVRFSEVLPLLQKGGDEFRKITRDIENSAGAAKKMSDVMRKGLAGMWEEFTGSIETLGIAIGSAMQPALEPLLKWATDLANKAVELATKFRELPTWMQATAGAALAAVAAVGPLALAFSGVAAAASSVLQMGGAIATGLLGIGNAAKAVYAGAVGLPATFSNIAMALSSGLVGALSKGELAILGLGKALLFLTAAWAGANIGERLYRETTWWGKVSDKVMTSWPFSGLDAIASGLHNVFSKTAADARAAEEQFHKMLVTAAEKLKEKGIIVEKGTMTWEQYRAKLAEVSNAYVAAGSSASGMYTQIAFAAGKFMDIQKQAADAIARVTNGLGLQKLSTQEMKALQLELTGLISKAREEIDKVNAGVKAGKIDKKDQTELEGKYLGVIKDLQASMAGLGVAAGGTGKALEGLASSKKKAAEAAKELKEAQDAISKFAYKVRDVLDELPSSFDALVNSSAKLRDIPKGFESQFATYDRLKEKIRDLRMEIEKAPVAAQGAMRQQLLELENAANQMGTWLGKIREQAKFTNELIAGLDAVEKSFQKTNAAAVKLPDILEEISKVDLSGIVKPLLTVEEALAGVGAKTPEILQNAVSRAKEAYETLRAAAAANKDYYGAAQIALQKWLEAEIALAESRGESTTALREQLQQEKALIDGVTTSTKEAATEMSQFTDALGKQISTVITDLSKGLADVIMGAKSFSEMMQGILDQLGKALVRFVVEYWTTQFVANIKKGIQDLWDAEKAAKKLQDTLGESGRKTVVPPSVPGGKNVEQLTGGSGLLGKFSQLTNSITMVASAISAITDVLMYLQGRRMEKDLGRIEVSTRGTLAQLISIQETLNRYIPGLDNLAYLEQIFLSLGQIAGFINDWGNKIVVAIERLAMKAAPVPVTPPNTPKGGLPPEVVPPGGDGSLPGEDPVEDLEQSMSWAANELQALGDSAEDAGKELGAFPIRVDEAGEVLERTAELVADVFEDVGRAVQQSGSFMVTSFREATFAVDEKTGLVSRMREFGEEYYRFVNGFAKVGVAVMDAEAELLAKIEGLSKIGGTVQELTRMRAELEAQLAAVRGTKSTGSSTKGSGVSGGVGATNPPVSSWGGSGLSGTVDGVNWGVSNTPINLNVTVNNADAQRVANTMIQTWRARGVDI